MQQIRRAPWITCENDDIDRPTASTSDDSDTDSDSDSSWKNYSPITSESEDEGDDDLRSNSSSRDVSDFDSSDEEDTPSNFPTSGSLQQGSTSNAPQTGNMAGVTSTKQQGAHALSIIYTFYFVFLHNRSSNNVPFGW